MRKNENIARFSADKIRRKIARGESKTDWKRVEAMSQSEVERLADKDEGRLTPDWESTVMAGLPPPSRTFTFAWTAIFSTGSGGAAEATRHASTPFCALSSRCVGGWNVRG